MRAPPNDTDATANLAGDAQIAALCHDFEAAWRKALDGGTPPSVEGYLDQVGPTERPALHGELTRIEGTYRRRHEQLCSMAAAAVLAGDGTAAGTAAGPADTTIDLRAGPAAGPAGRPADTAVEAPDRTVGFDPPTADPWATTFTHPPADATEACAPGEVVPKARRGPAELPTLPGYEVLGELGRGGMGVVYKARQVKLNRLVALKMVLAGAHAGEQELARFYTEAEAVAQLQHPNIVQIYEVGEHDGLPYFSLEYVDGGSLNQKLAGQPLPPRDAAHLVETLALAMGYAHLHGIIHRDLKPANVLLTRTGQPKVTDFGLAKRLEGDAGQTRSGTLMGTPNYMAPEQARGDTKGVGPLADVYALGAVLYQLLTGRTPFIGTSMLDILQQVREREPLPPGRLQPRVPRDLETICLKCLQKEPRKRYPSADALAEDLHRFLAGEPILARPVGGPERFWRWCTRNPWVAGLSAAVLTLLATVAVVSTTMAVRIAKAHAEAVAAKDLADRKAADEAAARALADAAEARARRSAEEALAQSKLALGAFGTLVGEVQKQIGDSPGMQPLKTKLIETALEGLDKVAKSDEDSRLLGQTMAAAYMNMGAIFQQLGQSEKAFAQYQKCHEITQALAARDPDGDVARSNLAATFTKLGEMSVDLRRDMQASLGYYQKALDIRKDLVRRPASDKHNPTKVKQELGESYTRVGVTYYRLGEPERAREYFRDALALRQELADAAPTDPGARLDLARSHNALAEVGFRARDWAAAREHFGQALAAGERVLRDHPGSPRHKSELANTLGNFGLFEVRTGRRDTARGHYARSLALMQELADLDARNAIYRRYLGLAHYRSATLARLAGDAEAARDHNEKCLAIREQLAAADAKNAPRRLDLLLVLPRCGQHARAAAEAAKVLAGPSPDREVLVQLAQCYAQCAAAVPDAPDQRRQYTDAALNALDRAVAQGYTDRVILETEPDLDAVRDDPQFRALLDRIKAR